MCHALKFLIQKRPLNKYDNFENLTKTKSFVEIVLSRMRQWQWFYGVLTVNATMVVNKNPLSLKAGR